MTSTAVIVPTIGRRAQLEGCLLAVLACDRQPDEVLIVDQSGEGVACDVARRHGAPIRVISDSRRGAASARNRGAQAAQSELLLFIDDDCLADKAWIRVAVHLYERYPTAILTGQVLPGPGPGVVPSTREDPRAMDHTGMLASGALYSGNMVVNRAAFLEFGGFDDRFPSAGGEDNDLCYRWLRAGKGLRYEPDLVVTHVHWRSASELNAVRSEYGRTQGMFYAKHLRAGDLRVLSFLAGDFRSWLTAWSAREPTRTPAVPALSVQLASIVRNWRRFR